MNSSLTSSQPSGIRRRSPHLVLALGAAMAFALGLGAAAQDVPSKPKSPFTSQCAQHCFDEYVDNIERCKSIFCTSILFLTFCDDENLTSCIDNANDVFQMCIAACHDTPQT